MATKKKKKRASTKNTSKKKTTSKKSTTSTKTSTAKKTSTTKKSTGTTKKSTGTKTTAKKSTSTTKRVGTGAKKTSTKTTTKKVSAKKPVVKELILKEEPKSEVKNDKLEIANLNRIGLLFGVALVLIFVFLCITAFIKNRESSLVEFDKINLNKYLDLYLNKDEELQFIYLSNDSCYMCDTYETNLGKIELEYKIKIKELNITNLNDSDLKKLEDSTAFLSNGVNAPIILAIKDGKEINGLSGIKEYSVLKKFVEYSKNPTSNSFLNVSLSKYISLLNSKDTVVIYIGSSTNKACVSFSKTLDSVASKKGIKINYLDTEDILTEDGWNKLKNSNEIFSGEWFLPVIMVVKNGEIVNYKMESMDEEDLSDFFDRNGF